MQRKTEIRHSLLAALTAGVLVVIVFCLSGRFPGQKHIFLYGDYYVQYMHFIRLFLRNLLEGRSLTYSFEISMGMPSWAVYAYESFSPFNFWFLLIEDADTAAFFVVLSKLMVCAAAFCFFAEHTLKTPPWCAFTLGCIYALCGYNMSFCYNVQYLDGVYLLPVLMLCLHRFIKTGRYTALAVVYACSFSVLFYSGYMLGIFSFVVWIALLWYEFGGDRKRMLQNVRRFVLCVFCAVLLSAVVTLPVVVFLFQNSPEDATPFQAIRVDIGRFIMNFLPGQSEKVDGTSPAVYSGILPIADVICFFADKKQEKHRKVFAAVPIVFLLLCTFVPPVYLLIHGFDATDLSHFRFAWMYSFVFLSITAVESRRLFAAPAFQKKGAIPWNRLLPVLTLCELLLHGYFSLTPDSEDLIRSGDYYQRWQKEGTRAMEQIEDMEKEQGSAFFRVYYENPQGDDQAAWFGYHGIGCFSSLEQPALRRTLYRLGYSTSPRVVSDYGSTPFTRMLFGQKYLVHGTHPLYEEENAFVVLQNPCFLAPAYMVTERMADYHLPGEDVFENQNDLARAMSGLDVDIYEAYSGEVRTQCSGLREARTTEGIRLTSENGKGGSCSYVLDPEPGRLLYAYFSQDSSSESFHTAKIGTNWDIGQPLTASYLSMPHILPVSEDGEIRILIGEEDAQICGFRNMYASYLRENAFYEVYEELSSGNVKAIDFQEDRISFTANATEEKPLLFTSIPYDPGWTAVVDGTPAEMFSTLNNAFLALRLSPGEHRVELRYRDRSVMAGAVLSMVGAMLLLVLKSADRRPRHAAGSSRNASAE